jgi:hypothetical protein
MTDEQLSALLRLKRHETPPPGYFDQLLADVHRRQRAELLQRPLWKIALERFQTFFGEHSMGPYSYAGVVASAVAAVALVVGAVNWLPSHTGSGDSLAAIGAPPEQQEARHLTLPIIKPGQVLSAQAQPYPDAPRFAEALSKRQPRYVIDARPVSYERPSSF